MNTAQIALFATACGVVSFLAGCKLILWHVLKCCRCSAHLRVAQERFHTDGCQPHGSHRLHDEAR